MKYSTSRDIMGEAEALLLDRSSRLAEHETALEQGWLLAELEEHFGYGLEELARRFDRSVSWVSRRLALVELLPESIQQQVREGKISAHVAMKCLVPAARINVERMAAIFEEHHCDTRQAGELYTAWRKGSAVIRKRILNGPELFFKTQRHIEVKPPTTAASELLRDLEIVAAIVSRAQRRLAGAEATEMDSQQREAARHQVDRIQSQLRRIGKVEHLLLFRCYDFYPLAPNSGLFRPTASIPNPVPEVAISASVGHFLCPQSPVPTLQVWSGSA